MANPESDQLIVRLLLNGNHRAVNKFTESYGQFIYNVCYKILSNTHDAEEATQDSVMKILKNIHTFDTNSSLKAWCYTIAYRTSIDHKRKSKYYVELNGVTDIAYDKQADDLIEQQELKSRVNKMIQLLDDESKMIVTLFYLEERNVKEVAELTGLTTSNIKIKLFRARKLMSEYANKYISILK